MAEAGITGETPASTPPSSGEAASLRRSLRSASCRRMSATSRRETSPAPVNTAVACSGSSVCRCTFRVVVSPTTSTESPSASSGAMKRPGLNPSPVTAKLVQKR